MRIPGYGPPGAPLAIVGGAPSWEDQRTGRPFSGRAGTELAHHLEAIGVVKGECYLTNLHREFHGKDHSYGAEEVAADGAELLAELAAVHPQVIVTLGRDAMRFLLGDHDLESTWGLPWLTDAHGVVFPAYHVNAGTHNSDLAVYVVASFQALGQYLAGAIPVRRLHDDPYPEPHYEHITTRRRLGAVLRACQREPELLPVPIQLRVSPNHVPEQTSTEPILVGVDSEGVVHAPWSLQFTARPGEGYLLSARDPDLLRAFTDDCRRQGVTLIYHSALHELSILAAMGLPTDLPFEDTMVMAYLLCIEPQALKQGALRHCNMQMQSFDDLMGDIANERARDYLTWVWDGVQAAYTAARQAVFAAEIAKGRRVKVLPKLPKPKLLRAVERCLASKRPRGLWEDQDEAVQGSAVAAMGPLPEPSLDDVEPAAALHYAGRDPDATIRYYAALKPKIKAMGLEDVYRLELSTYPLIARMSQVGITPDLEHFAGLSLMLAHELEGLQAELDAVTGIPEFNPNSGDQVAAYLFETLGLPPGKITSGGRGTTSKKYLKDLEYAYPEYPQVGLMRAYRETYKLKNSFVDVVPHLIKGWPHDGRVHVLFRTTRIPTGRLAASMPEGFPRYNMLAQPKRGKYAKMFRQGWVAGEGHLFMEFDLSQIELRVGAHLSQDPYMLAVYRGEVRNPDGTAIDLHAGLAQRIFGVLKRDQTNEQRVASKEINFGFWMGQTNKGLTVSLRSNGVMVDEDDAQKWLDEANATYAGAQPYKDRMIAEARQHGYIRCMDGRIRYIGGINSRDDRVREEAERFAFGTPVQAGAQTLMKRAEASLYTEVLVPYWRQGRWVEPLLQIHDALLLECEDDPALAQELNMHMTAIMTRTPPGFSVPVETSGDYGRNWAEMRGFDQG